MKIAIDARMISSSTGRYAERLLHYLERLDQKNDYLVLVRKKDHHYWTPTNPRFSVVVADFKYYSFAEQTSYLSFLNALDVDLVHFLMPQQPVLYRKPHVTTIHDLTLLNTYNSDKNWLAYHLKQFVGRFVFKSVARSSRAVITPSQYTKQSVLQLTPLAPSKILVTYEAADSVASVPAVYPDAPEEFLLYVGQQSDYKNIRRLIQAHQGLMKNHPDLHLLLVGSKNDAVKNNEAWVDKNSYRQVVFTGFVADDQLQWLYKAARCYVFPSLMEGFGLPGLEAMRAGSPVASSDATCLPEIYANAALYFNPKDTGDMVVKIDRILTDDELRATLISNGTKRAGDFSWERMAEQTLSAYYSAMTRPSRT